MFYRRKLVLATIAGTVAGWVYAASKPKQSDTNSRPTPSSRASLTRDLPKFAIMQGATDTRHTQVLVLTPGDDRYRFLLRDKKGRKVLPFLGNSKRFSDSPYTVHHLSFNNLNPDTSYLFQVRSTTTPKLIDERRLRTLAPGKRSLRFAVASCMYDKDDQGDIWQRMIALRPDVIFLIGDNVYADMGITGVKAKKIEQIMATPADLWRRHAETRSRITLFRSKDLIPVIASWDDHDYGMNNGGRDYPFKNESRAIFRAFFGSKQNENFHPAGIGLASFFTIYGFNFFLLDNRTFRTSIFSSTQPRHYGDEQLRWLWHGLRQKDYAFIVGGDQFFGAYHRFESFAGNHSMRFKQFLAELKTLPTRVAFLSGDRHLTEIMQIPAKVLGYQTYEFTTSPIHAKLYPSNWDKTPNPLQIQGQDLHHNFMFFEVKKTSNQMELRVSSHSKRGRILFKGNYILQAQH